MISWIACEKHMVFFGMRVFCCNLVGWLKGSRKRMVVFQLVVCQLGNEHINAYSIWLLNTYNWWSTSRIKLSVFFILDDKVSHYLNS